MGCKKIQRFEENLFGIEQKKGMLAGFEFLCQYGAKAMYCLLFQGSLANGNP